MYGNKKFYRNSEDPLLCLITSQINTPTYEVAQKLNDILKNYTSSKHSVNSTYEFIDLVSGSNITGVLVSLDVDSSFTIVAVKDTIEIIMNHAYFHQAIASPKFHKMSGNSFCAQVPQKRPFYTQIEI